MKLIRDMTEQELGEFFRGLALEVEALLPAGPSSRGKCLFFLTVSDRTGPGTAQYVSNIRREDAILFLRETADRLEAMEDEVR